MDRESNQSPTDPNARAALLYDCHRIARLDARSRPCGQFDHRIRDTASDADPRPERLDAGYLVIDQPEHVQRHPDEEHVDGPVGRLPEGEHQRVAVGDIASKHQAAALCQCAVGRLGVAGEDATLFCLTVNDSHGQ